MFGVTVDGDAFEFAALDFVGHELGVCADDTKSKAVDRTILQIGTFGPRCEHPPAEELRFVVTDEVNEDRFFAGFVLSQELQVASVGRVSGQHGHARQGRVPQMSGDTSSHRRSLTHTDLVADEVGVWSPIRCNFPSNMSAAESVCEYVK